MKNRGPASEHGYSLIEVVIVVVIVAILATFAILALGSSTRNLGRQNIAKEFKVALERARFDSVRRRATECAAMARVEITSASSFSLITDLNQNGVIDPASDTRTVDFGAGNLVQIVDDPPPTYPVIIRFDQRGHTSSGPCGAETAVDTPTVFCELPCTAATASGGNSSMVFVSPTGTAAMLTGGETIPTFSDPAVTTIDSAAQINPLLAVWDLVVGTPTPTPTPSPVPTVSPIPIPTVSPTPVPTVEPTPVPTVSPSPVPSVSPTVVPTPSPSPTPVYCTSGQRPAQDNCVCAPNQYLHSNGRCRNL